MQNDILKIIFLLSALFYFNALTGQVWYKLDLMEDQETYQISLVSDVSWSLPNNITSTGQVTIKAPTLEFDVEEFESIHPQLTWEYNSRFNAPLESSDFDYFSFGLASSSRDFDYEAGEEVPIIRFKNSKGCSDFVGLLDNDVDPYAFSKTKKVNVGNQLTVVGARGNAYLGNKGIKLVKCKKQIKTKDLFVKDLVLFPNPAFNILNINLDWTTDNQIGQFFIRDNSGKVIVNKQQQLQKGFNEINFDIAPLAGGIYHIELTNAAKEIIPLDRFVKIYSASIDGMKNNKDKEENASSKKDN